MKINNIDSLHVVAMQSSYTLTLLVELFYFSDLVAVSGAEYFNECIFISASTLHNAWLVTYK